MFLERFQDDKDRIISHSFQLESLKLYHLQVIFISYMKVDEAEDENNLIIKEVRMEMQEICKALSIIEKNELYQTY